MSCNADDLVERLLECQKELDEYKTDLDTWINCLEELSEIQDAFEADEKDKLHGKTILEVGTDCVKPLYLALKFEPAKIIGIDEDFSLHSFASEIEQKSKLLTKTTIRFYECSLFDDENLKKIRRKEKKEKEKFDFVLISKTLHHLRAGECVLSERDLEHECREDEKCCIYKFEEQKIFDNLLQLGNRVIVYEAFYPHEKDEDKVRGRGGYFTVEEWHQIFNHLSKNYRVEFVKPLRCQLSEKELKNVIAKLRQVDHICFYIETK